MYSPPAQNPAPRDPGVPLLHGERQTEAVIDLGAIVKNLRIYREHTDVPLMAVVKADGYGHGAAQVGRTALAHGASWLAVSFPAEALSLRAAGITAPILAFMHLPDEDLSEAVLADIDLTVSSTAHLDGVARYAERLGRTARIQLKVDTGLHRNGESPAQWPALVEAAVRLEQRGLVHVSGVWSHLVYTLEPENPVTVRQFEAFDDAVRVAEEAGLTGRIAHIASSAAGLVAPKARHNMIRVGSSLYGVETAIGRKFGLVPAMTLRTRVVMTRQVAAGEGVSYEHLYLTPEPGTLAVLPLGYADGLPRAASGKAQVWVAGTRRPIAGWITMTSSVVDAGPAEVEMGDEVVVFGTGEQGEPTVAEWAEWAGTGSHEVLTRIGPLVPRRYIPVADEEVSPADKRMRIAVLFGGPGGEYDISCASGATIISYLDRDRYAVQPVRISPEGRWIQGPADWPAGETEPEALLAATPDPAVRTGDRKSVV